MGSNACPRHSPRGRQPLLPTRHETFSMSIQAHMIRLLPCGIAKLIRGMVQKKLIGRP